MFIDFTTLFLRHDGRLDRRSFWAGLAILIVCGVFAATLPVIGQLVSLLSLWPAFCLLAQRLHDTGRSSRAAVAVMLTAAVLGVVAVVTGFVQQMPDLYAAILPVLAMTALCGGLASLVAIVFVIWAGLTPGQGGSNDWGASPNSPIELGRATPATRFLR